MEEAWIVAITTLVFGSFAIWWLVSVFQNGR
jgi:hypothetical protein